MIENLFTFVRTLGNQRIEGKKFFVTQVGLLGTVSDNTGSIGTAGKVLSSTGSGVEWITVGSSNVQSLNDLTDVVINTAVEGNLLRYNGTSWVNWAPNFLTSYGSLNDLSDVDAANPDNGQILRYNDLTDTWYASDESVVGIPTLQDVTDEGSTTTNTITAAGFSTAGSVTASVVTTPLIEREGILTINSEQQVDQGEPNPDLLYVSWLGDNKFVVDADGYAIATTGFKVVGGTSSGFLKADGTIDTSTYITSYTETQTLDDVTTLGSTTANTITVGGVVAPTLGYNGLLTINADSGGGLQPQQGDPAVPVLSFQWAGTQQGYIDTDGKITFNGFKTPTGTSSGFLKANGTVDTNAYITEVEYIDDIGDVTISSAASGDVLMFDGVGWVNSQIQTDYTSKVQHEVKAGVAIAKGQAVYVTSADGTNMIVGLASNASEATSSKTMGLALTSAAVNGHFFVVTEGLIDGLDTSTATAGDPVWLGTNGNLIFGLTNKPVAPAHLVYIGVVTRVQQNNGEIFVSVQNGFELQELHNVLISSPSEGQLLRRDSDGLWKNWTPNYITASSSDVLTNKRINLSTGLTSAVPVDSIDEFLGQNDIPLYQDGIDKGGTINVDEQGNVTISNPGIGYYSGAASTIGGTRFSVTVAGNTLTGTIAEFNAALTDGDFATQAYVSTQIASLVDSAPSTLDTLNELAAALGDDPNFATTVATSIGLKQDKLNGVGFVKASGTTITYDNSSYITSESDPVFVGSAAYGITNEDIISWNDAYSWGNHAEAGYLTTLPDHTHIIADVTGLQAALNGKADLNHTHDDRYYTESEIDSLLTGKVSTDNFKVLGGGVDYDTDRTLKIQSGLAIYGAYSGGDNSPFTYDIAAQFAFGSRAFEFSADWINDDGANLKLRTLRDCCQNWSPWVDVITSYNISQYALTSLPAHSHTIADVTGLQTALDGKLTSESDPVFVSSVAYNIASEDVTNWNEAFGWGNHANFGYLTSYTETDTLAAVTGRGNVTSTPIRVEAAATGLGGYISVGNSTEVAGNYSAYFFGNTAGDASYFKGGIAYETIASTYGRGNIHFLQNTSTSSGIVTLSDSVMTILNNGKVGVGNTNPTAKFQVGPEAHSSATGIEVAAGAGGANLLARDSSTHHNWFPYTDGNNYYSAGSHNFRSAEHGTPWVIISASDFTWGGNTVATRSWVQAQGYITGYTETDTLATVTARGASTATSVTFSGGFNATGTQDIISSISFHRLHPSSGSPLNIDSLSSFILSKTDGGYGGGTKPGGSHNGFAVISLQTHTGNYFTQLGLDTNQNDLWIRSANNTSSFGSWVRLSTRDWVQAQGYLTSLPAHNHDNDYINVAGDRMSGDLTLKYTTANTSDYNGLMFAPYSDADGLNDYIIKAASDKGVFGRKSFGWHVHSESAFGVYSNGWVQLFGVEGGTGNTQVFGNLTVSGSITESSSIRYKKDVVDIESASAKVEQLKPVRYKKIKDDQEEIGLIAEDVAELFPEVVKYDKEGRPDGVNYSRLSVILLKAVQELTERVNKLENK